MNSDVGLKTSHDQNECIKSYHDTTKDTRSNYSSYYSTANNPHRQPPRPLLPLPQYRSPCAWIWSWSYRGVDKDRDSSDGGGRIESASATTLACGLPIGAEAGGTRVLSWMQTETASAIGKRNGSLYDAETHERDARDPKMNSLLWQPHIGILLVIDALFSVCISCLFLPV